MFNNRRERLNGEFKDSLGRARGHKTLNPPRVALHIIYPNFIHATNNVIPAKASGIFIN